MSLDLTLPPAELALALVDVPSPSGAEGPLADAVEAALRGLGHLTVGRLGDAVVARTDLGRGRRVLVAGHLDTVPIKDNVPGCLREGRLWGRGAVDMKGGLAAMLTAAAAVSAPRSDVTWVFYDNEEVSWARSGLGRLIAKRRDWISADFGVLCEPTAGRIEGGCNGTLRARLEARGRAAHSARPWTGSNAIHALAPALEALAVWEAPTVEVEGLAYREALNAVKVEGGVAGNVIPDRASLWVNYRFAPAKTEAEASRVVEAMFEGYLVEVEDSAPGARPGLDDPLARRLAAVVAEAGGGPPRAKLGWTDVARLASIGIPAVNFGPGDPEAAHQDDEACPADQIDLAAGCLTAFLA
ncbi:MAG: succinyl-diaminopimelate desuccinylase [Bifidobacteriaceae bacterium]|nr:succinyl-diaminopimelate desuccinylase [Bifidobacteriaceae bacterium]